MTEAEIPVLPRGGAPRPVSEAERLESLDVLRGVGVLGILVMNIYAFAMPLAAYGNPLAMGGREPLNIGTWFVTHILFDQKFMSIFSMLFGAGIVLMAERAEAKGAQFGPIFLRRQLWLLVIGLVHAYLIWFGDILFFYAVVGMVLFFFRSASPLRLIVAACVLLPVAPLFSYAGGVAIHDLKVRADALEARQALGETLGEEDLATIEEWAEARGLIVPGRAEIDEELAAYRGGYADNLEHRASFVFEFHAQGLLFFVFWRIGGLMLIGMALMKLGVLSAARGIGFYRRMTIAGYGTGLPLTVFSAINAYGHSFDGLYMFKIGSLPNYVGSILVALGHVGLVMLVLKSGALARLMERFAAVGRVALSNYLLHSIVMTAIFYGWGFGLYGGIPRFWQMAFVAGLICVQLVLCPWWLAQHRFGPAEWVWRSLVYGRRQPMRREFQPKQARK